jgi:hypothetical protein
MSNTLLIAEAPASSGLAAVKRDGKCLEILRSVANFGQIRD